jgi:hypothetical protein
MFGNRSSPLIWLRLQLKGIVFNHLLGFFGRHPMAGDVSDVRVIPIESAW